MCRYAALANVRLPITVSGRVAVSGQPYTATDGQNQMSAATHPSPLSSSYERVHRPTSARSLRQSCEHTRCSNAWHKSVAGHRSRSRVATTNGGRFISRWSSFRYLSDYCR